MPRRQRRIDLILPAALLGGGLIFLLAGSAVAAAPAKVVLTIEDRAAGRQAIGTVLDGGGQPSRDVPIVFKMQTAFGWLILGEGSTDAAGRATMNLPPAPWGTIRVEAGDDGALVATLPAGRGAIAIPPPRPGREALRALSPQPGLVSPYPIPGQVALLLIALSGVWGAYVYVVRLLIGIRASPS